LVERLGCKPRIGEGGTRPRVEVVAPEREEAVEGLAVRGGELGLLLEAGRQLVEPRLGLGHSGAAGEVAAQRLPRPHVLLPRDGAAQDVGCLVSPSWSGAEAPPRIMAAGTASRRARGGPAPSPRPASCRCARCSGSCRRRGASAPGSGRPPAPGPCPPRRRPES